MDILAVHSKPLSRHLLKELAAMNIPSGARIPARFTSGKRSGVRTGPPQILSGCVPQPRRRARRGHLAAVQLPEKFWLMNRAPASVRRERLPASQVAPKRRFLLNGRATRDLYRRLSSAIARRLSRCAGSARQATEKCLVRFFIGKPF